MTTHASIGIHDIGGKLEYEPIDTRDHPLHYWEQSIHALLVLLSQKSPPLLTTDELRRGVECLEKHAYETWGYYERWSAAMANILLERRVLQEDELSYELEGPCESHDSPQRKFYPGDAVQVRSEDSRIRWRKPHLRCPGYIFGCIGKVEKYIGLFDDPYLAAYRGSGPQQHLYSVSFDRRDLWQEGGDEISQGDRITVEVYEGWLMPPVVEPVEKSNTFFSSNRGVGVVGSGGKTTSDEHTHADEHSLTSSDPVQSNIRHTLDHDHGHVHESRVVVECEAVEKESPDPPGKIVGEALLRALYKKNVVNPADIREKVQTLEQMSERLLGADLVVKAWMDSEFRTRLLNDAPRAALEIGIHTSNSNAPTVLQVVECTESVHHLVVCTLCSCYPSSLLGLSPSWYRSRSYRCRAIREPRKVLSEFGTKFDSSVAIHVHDSTADCRFLVLPMRPGGTEGWTEDQLRALVTRDSMIGVALARDPLTVDHKS